MRKFSPEDIINYKRLVANPKAQLKRLYWLIDNVPIPAIREAAKANLKKRGIGLTKQVYRVSVGDTELYIYGAEFVAIVGDKPTHDVYTKTINYDEYEYELERYEIYACREAEQKWGFYKKIFFINNIIPKLKQLFTKNNFQD